MQSNLMLPATGFQSLHVQSLDLSALLHCPSHYIILRNYLRQGIMSRYTGLPSASSAKKPGSIVCQHPQIILPDACRECHACQGLATHFPGNPPLAYMASAYMTPGIGSALGGFHGLLFRLRALHSPSLEAMNLYDIRACPKAEGIVL